MNSLVNSLFFKLPFVFLVVLLSGLSGCASKLMVETSVNVPVPLIQKLSLNVAIDYPEATRNHVYKNPDRDGTQWSIATGASQIQLIDHISQAMFSSVQTLSASAAVNNDSATAFDLILVPALQDMQFSLPHKTGFEFYDAWVRYEITVKQPDGSVIATFPLTGYGNSAKHFFSTDKEGLRDASNLAFRDLGAKLILTFKQHPDIKRWLAANGAVYEQN